MMAGELGSYVANLYQNGVFLSEAMLSGRTAAQTAFGAVSKFEAVTKSENNGPAWADAADGVYTGVRGRPARQDRGLHHGCGRQD